MYVSTMLTSLTEAILFNGCSMEINISGKTLYSHFSVPLFKTDLCV